MITSSPVMVQVGPEAKWSVWPGMLVKRSQQVMTIGPAIGVVIPTMAMYRDKHTTLWIGKGMD